MSGGRRVNPALIHLSHWIRDARTQRRDNNTLTTQSSIIEGKPDFEEIRLININTFDFNSKHWKDIDAGTASICPWRLINHFSKFGSLKRSITDGICNINVILHKLFILHPLPDPWKSPLCYFGFTRSCMVIMLMSGRRWIDRRCGNLLWQDDTNEQYEAISRRSRNGRIPSSIGITESINIKWNTSNPNSKASKQSHVQTRVVFQTNDLEICSHP